MEFAVPTTGGEPPHVCRCCLTEGCHRDVRAEYFWMGEKEIYADMLKECFDVAIFEDGTDGEARRICEACVTRLRDASSFKRQVVRSLERFADHLCYGVSLSTVSGDSLPPKHEVSDNERSGLSFGDETRGPSSAGAGTARVSPGSEDEPCAKKPRLNGTGPAAEPAGAGGSGVEGTSTPQVTGAHESVEPDAEKAADLEHIAAEDEGTATVKQPPDVRCTHPPCKPEPTDTTLLKGTRQYPPAKRRISPTLREPEDSKATNGGTAVSGGAGGGGTGMFLLSKVNQTVMELTSPGGRHFIDPSRRTSNGCYDRKNFWHEHELDQESHAAAETAYRLDKGINQTNRLDDPSAVDKTVASLSPTDVTEWQDGELPDQAGTSSVSIAAPPLGEAGSDSKDPEDDLPLARLARTVNTFSFVTELGSEEEVLLDELAAAQDLADESILPEANGVYDWTSDYTKYQGAREVFTADAPGPTTQRDTIYGNFCAIWDKPIMTYIADMTNLYAEQKAADMFVNDKWTDGHNDRWTPTNVDELYVYFAVLMYMTIDVRTSLKEYWQKGTPLEMPKFKYLMTYDRFAMLNCMIHFVDKTKDLPADVDPEVANLQPIIDHCNEKFQSCYVLHRNIMIDDSLTLWKSRLDWVHDVVSKVSCRGVKTHELCESYTGYLWKFYVCGENSTTDVGKTSVVLDLMKDLLHKGYCLTMDEFYNSPALARHLKSAGVDVDGTIRRNRRNVPGIIKRLTERGMADGKVVYQHCGDVSLLARNDGTLVTKISTYRSSEAGEELFPIKRNISAIGGVYRKDEKHLAYLLERKRGLKWSEKLFRRLLNASVMNSFIMYSDTIEKLGRPLPKYSGYMYLLCKELLKHHDAPSPTVRLASEGRYDGADHNLFPIKQHVCAGCVVDDDSNCKKCTYARRNCVWCYASALRKGATTECRKCAKSLCVGTCFVKFHTRA